MVRGNSDWPQGMKVDGRFIFRAEDDAAYPWGQGGGINAGVILLRPCSKTLAQMVSEVTSEVHPEHVPGSGPEQDYLSRFFAISGTPWHSISVAYNFQLHHVPFALEAVLNWRKYMAEHDGDAPEVEWLPARLRLSAQDILNVHFSGDVKLWHVLLNAVGNADRLSLEHVGASWANDDAFADHLLRSCCEDYRQWEDGVLLAEDASQDVAKLVQDVYSRLRDVARLAVKTWHDCADRLLACAPGLLQELLCPKGPPDTRPIGTRVEVLWPPDAVAAEGGGRWWPATVASVHDNGHYCLRLDRGGEWGNLVRNVAPARLRVSD